MNGVLSAPRPEPGRAVLQLILTLAFWLASALSFAPTVVRAAASVGHAAVCHCAHCPGANKCCCGVKGLCP